MDRGLVGRGTVRASVDRITDYGSLFPSPNFVSTPLPLLAFMANSITIDSFLGVFVWLAQSTVGGEGRYPGGFGASLISACF